MTTQTHLTNVYGMSRDTCTGCPATLHPGYAGLSPGFAIRHSAIQETRSATAVRFTPSRGCSGSRIAPAMSPVAAAAA